MKQSGIDDSIYTTACHGTKIHREKCYISSFGPFAGVGNLKSFFFCGMHQKWPLFYTAVSFCIIFFSFYTTARRGATIKFTMIYRGIKTLFIAALCRGKFHVIFLLRYATEMAIFLHRGEQLWYFYSSYTISCCGATKKFIMVNHGKRY